MSRFLIYSEKPLQAVGRGVYRKQGLLYSSFVNPNDPKKKVGFDREYGDKLITNFKANVFDSVPFQVTHEENPLLSAGNIIGMEHSPDGSGLDFLLSVTDEKVIEKIEEKDALGNPTVRGVSVGLENNYRDKKTGELLGPVVRHLALVTHPYIKGMKPFESVNFGEEDEKENPYIILQEETPVTMEEVLAFLRQNGMNFADAESLKKAATAPTVQNITLNADIEAAVTKALGQQFKLEDGKSLVDVVSGLSSKVTALSDSNTALITENKAMADKMLLADAEGSVGKYMREGKILPAEKDSMVKLYLADTELYTAMVTARPVLVQMGEKGRGGTSVLPGEETEKLADVAATVNKYADVYKNEILPFSAAAGK